MSHRHFVCQCKHGIVVSQCRCANSKKEITVVSCGPECPPELEKSKVEEAMTEVKRAIDILVDRAGIGVSVEEQRAKVLNLILQKLQEVEAYGRVPRFDGIIINGVKVTKHNFEQFFCTE